MKIRRSFVLVAVAVTLVAFSLFARAEEKGGSGGSLDSGTIGGSVDSSVGWFGITFPGSPLPPAIGIPSGYAELSGSSFTTSVFLGTSAADYGRIFEMAEDSSLTPVFEFSGVLVNSHPPTPGFPGSGGTFYSYFQTWDLTSLQAQSLVEGHWYMEIAFGTETHFAQIIPVPEPTSAALLVSGIAFVAVCYRRRLQR